MIVSGEFIISLVLSPQQKFEVTDGPVSWFSFIGKQRKIHPPGVRTCRPKRREEKHPAQFWLLFLCFFLLPLSLPSVNWLSRRAVILPEVLTPVLRPSFVLFLWAFPFFVFQPLPFWTPFSYSNYLTISYSSSISIFSTET